MRNGNHSLSLIRNWLFVVLILPMRNGNLEDEVQNTVYTALVLILPMRNGNIPRAKISNLTHEFLSYLWGMETIMTLWNIYWKRCEFLSYLWGMETSLSPIVSFFSSCSYPTYEEWKPTASPRFVKTGCVLVLILPMRNGNKTTKLNICKLKKGSYPTYEEWKLPSLLI